MNNAALSWKAFLLLIASLPNLSTMATSHHGTTAVTSLMRSFTSPTRQEACVALSAFSGNHRSFKHSSAIRPRQARAAATVITDSFQHRQLVANSSMCNNHHHDRCSLFPHRFFSATTQLFMTNDDDDDGESSISSTTNDDEKNTKTTRTSYDLPNLKKEITRLALRTHKKIGKASTRIQAAKDQWKELRAAMEDTPSDQIDEELMQQLEKAPSTTLLEQYQSELKELQANLQKLNWLEEQFARPPLNKKKILSVDDMRNPIVVPDGWRIAEYIQELDIDDDENSKQKRIEADERNKRSKKERAAAQSSTTKQNQQGGRLPYRRYYTENQIEVRVSGLIVFRDFHFFVQ